MNNLKDLIVSKIESKREIAKSNVDKQLDKFAETLKWVEKDNPKLLNLIQFILDHSGHSPIKKKSKTFLFM